MAASGRCVAFPAAGNVRIFDPDPPKQKICRPAPAGHFFVRAWSGSASSYQTPRSRVRRRSLETVTCSWSWELRQWCNPRPPTRGWQQWGTHWWPRSIWSRHRCQIHCRSRCTGARKRSCPGWWKKCTRCGTGARGPGQAHEPLPARLCTFTFSLVPAPELPGTPHARRG
jgi:hypothetical protein